MRTKCKTNITHTLLTTKLSDVQFKQDNISAKFDVIKITLPKYNGDRNRSRSLENDMYEYLGQEINVCSVVRTRDSIYFLIRKSKISSELLQESQLTKFKEMAVEHIAVGYLIRNSQNILLQLLFHMLHTHESLLQALGSDEQMPYWNCTGALYYTIPEGITKEDYRYYLNISISKDNCITIGVTTFSKYNKQYDKDRTFYIADGTSMRLKRKSETVPENMLYIKKGKPHKKNTVKAYKFDRKEGFLSSKSGVLLRFITDCDRYLSEFVTFSLTRRENVTYLQEISEYCSLPIELKTLALEVCKRKSCFNVIIPSELANDEQMLFIKTQLCQALMSLKCNIREEKKLCCDAFNIVILHEKDFYSSTKLNVAELKDSYGSFASNSLCVQHITPEKTTEIIKNGYINALISKIFLEFLIKDDVLENRITLFKWEEFAMGKTWSFVMPIVNKKEHHTVTDLTFICMKITPSGQIQFDNFRVDRDPLKLLDTDFDTKALTPEQKNISDAYDFATLLSMKQGNNLEVLFFNDINNIHYISCSQERCLPEIFNLYKALIGSDNTRNVDAHILYEILTELYSTCDLSKDNDTACIDNLKELLLYRDVVTIGEIKKCFPHKQNGAIFIALSQKVKEKLDITLNAGIRQKGNDKFYQISSLLGIGYFKHANRFCYYAGSTSNIGSIKTQLPVSNLIREVACINNPCSNIFEEILPLLLIDFIRVGDFTVLPFPFKYLREYALLKNNELTTDTD